MSYRITKINIHLIVCFNCIILCDYSQFLNNLGDNIIRTKCCCSTTVRTAALCSIFICQSFCYTRLVIAIRKHIYTLPALLLFLHRKASFSSLYILFIMDTPQPSLLPAIIPHRAANYSAVSGFPANPAYTLPHSHRI